MCRWFLAGVAICGLANVALADTIIFSGGITQSTQDGTGPAENNPALNGILDGDAYTVVLVFAGAITLPGTYSLTGASLGFHDPAAAASETSFDSISLTVSPDGGFDDIFLVGCLTTGSGCLTGNQLSAAFRISAGDLNSGNVVAGAIPDLSPSLDLLEDGGITDIQGSVTAYSYHTAVPEPSPAILLGFLLAPLAWKRLRQIRHS